MEKKIEKAWQLLLKGDFAEAKNVVRNDFTLESCEDYALLNLMGYIYLSEKNFHKSRKIFKKYITLAKEKSDFEQQHIGLHQLAMVNREQGRFEDALDCVLKEKDILEKYFENDKLKTAVNLYEIGYINFKLDNIHEALDVMNLSLYFAEQTDDLIAQACSYRGLGEISFRTGKRELAIQQFEKSFQLFKRANEKLGVETVEELLKLAKSS